MAVPCSEASDQPGRRWRHFLFGVCLGLIALGAPRPVVGQQTGTLVVDMKNYTSDAKMSKNANKELEHAGLPWGILDNNTVLFSILEQKFVKAEMPYLARYGEQKTLEVKAGQYTITCIGVEFRSTSRNVDKNLTKSAFFNQDVVTFTVQPGKTTTLEVFPIYVKESAWRFTAKFSMFIPDLKVRVLEDGTPKGEDVVISQRTAQSVAWDDYHGPLKF